MSDNLFDTYLQYVEKTESPIIFHRWSLITCLAAYLGRQVWLPFGQFRVFPNMYVMLLGEPGTRKSSSIKIAKKMISKTGYGKDFGSFSAEKTTKEKFLLDLEGLTPDDGEVTSSSVMENLFGEAGVGNGEAREVFIVADEFNDFMRCGDLEFHSMLGALWDWDDESNCYKQRLKNSKSISIYQPTINILGGNTHTGFAEMFPPQAIGQGFLSRMLLIFSEPSGIKIAFPEPPPETLENKLIEDLQRIKANVIGAVTLNEKAKEVLQVLYNSYEGFTDVRFTSYFTRRYTHLLKMCILCAATRFSTTITMADVVLANTILSYAEHFMPKALGEFGKAKNADVANKILTFLTKENKPVDIPSIWKQVSSDLDRMEDLQKLMAGLQQAGKVNWIPKTATGVQGFLIVRKALGNRELYVDYNLLKEHKVKQL